MTEFHYEDEWQQELGELIEVGVNYGPPGRRRQVAVAITVTAAHSAPIGGDLDMARRVASGVLRAEAGAVCAADSDPTRTPMTLGYEQVDTDHPSYTNKWRKTLLAPGLDNLEEWTAFVRGIVGGQV